MLKYLLLISLLPSCVGTLNPENTPVSIAPSTTRSHCVALDVESDILPPIGIGMASVGTGFATYGLVEKDKAIQITAIIVTGVSMIPAGWGMYASKSWHEQCQKTNTTK